MTTDQSIMISFFLSLGFPWKAAHSGHPRLLGKGRGISQRVFRSIKDEDITLPKNAGCFLADFPDIIHSSHTLIHLASIYYHGIIFHLFWAYTIPLGCDVVFFASCAFLGVLSS